MDESLLRGQTENHLTTLLEFPGHQVHKDCARDLLSLQEKAKSQGFNLQLASSFRSFEKQLSIWNAKARGERALLDDQGIALDYTQLSEEEIVMSILRWSAIPGVSRHHWGTDIDVFDANALPNENYKVQLTPQEVQGIFAPFHHWLTRLIEKDDACGFFRPYQNDLGGVAPEMWHLSYRPLAEKYTKAYDFHFFLETLRQNDQLLLKDILLDRAEEIYERFVMNITL